MAYFKYLPKVFVRNKTRVNGSQPYELSVNIFRRIKIRDDLQGSLLGFTQYEIQDGTRPDQVAYLYYGDSELLWLIFLANNITDPYYDWPLNQNQFASFLISKYGSVAAAQAKILHYQKKVGGIASNSRDPNGTIITKDTFDLESTFNNINEASYAKVYAYDYENELNEAKRNIKLIDKRYTSQARTLLREIMIG